MRLSLIVPCFNEQDNIFPFARAVAEVFPDPSDYEIVFVNDGSKDKTLQNLKELHRQSQQNIRVVSFSRNFGKESAIYAGLQHCDGEYISLIDADLQQDPAIVKQMTEILDAEPDTDCVCAFQETRHENKLMTSVKSAFYKMATNMSEVDFVDGASDFRTFRRTVRDALLQMPEYFRFSKGLFSWVGFNTKYIPYEAKERASGTTKWGFKKLLKYGWNGILAFSTAPAAFHCLFYYLLYRNPHSQGHGAHCGRRLYPDGDFDRFLWRYAAVYHRYHRRVPGQELH